MIKNETTVSSIQKKDPAVALNNDLSQTNSTSTGNDDTKSFMLAGNNIFYLYAILMLHSNTNIDQKKKNLYMRSFQYYLAGRSQSKAQLLPDFPQRLKLLLPNGPEINQCCQFQNKDQVSIPHLEE